MRADKGVEPGQRVVMPTFLLRKTNRSTPRPGRRTSAKGSPPPRSVRSRGDPSRDPLPLHSLTRLSCGRRPYQRSVVAE